MDHPRSRSLSRPPSYDSVTSLASSSATTTSPNPTPQASLSSHQRAASGSSINTRPPSALKNGSGSAANGARRRRPSPSPSLLSASFLEPRIAVVLKIPKPWRPWLFFCRLLSICPAIYWGVQPALELLVRFILALPWSALLELLGADLGDQPIAVFGGDSTCPAAPGTLGGVFANASPGTAGRPRYPWTEMALGVIWCGSSGYLSFFFADCLMSRWLINYSPQAAIIRLLTINCANAFLTERILFFAGGFHDARLLLPGWISIATSLTVCYHITQRKINIKKETSTSINIFSIASFISVVTLLGHLHTSNPDYPDAPLLQIVRTIRTQWGQMAGENENSAAGTDDRGIIKCEL